MSTNGPISQPSSGFCIGQALPSATFLSRRSLVPQHIGDASGPESSRHCLAGPKKRSLACHLAPHRGQLLDPSPRTAAASRRLGCRRPPGSLCKPSISSVRGSIQKSVPHSTSPVKASDRSADPRVDRIGRGWRAKSKSFPARAPPRLHRDEYRVASAFRRQLLTAGGVSRRRPTSFRRIQSIGNSADSRL